MGYEEDLNDYIDELEHAYRRAMDSPLDGLTPEQTEATKQFQFDAKTQKETIQQSRPALLEGYQQLVDILVNKFPADPEYQTAQAALLKFESSLDALRAGLRHALEVLETALQARGRPAVFLEQDIVNPIDPTLPTGEKVQELQRLSRENEPLVQRFIEQIDQRYGTQSRSNLKAADRIKDKATRPSIKSKKPWFDVEHIRDGFRFKTVVQDITILPRIAQELKDAGFEIVKIDTDKVLEPGDWGWRIAVVDLRMPNGQLVEYYLPVQELEEAKNAGNHEIFEKWRNRALDELTEAEQMELYRDVDLSDERYEEAWQAYLQRTDQNEEIVNNALTEFRIVLES